MRYLLLALTVFTGEINVELDYNNLFKKFNSEKVNLKTPKNLVDCYL